MFFEQVGQTLEKIENEISASASQDELFERLRVMGLNDFALLLITMPNPAYPKISEILPRMASEEVQRNWTGNAGTELLRQTLDFVRSLVYNYCKYTGEVLDNKTILDFGCGYGRMARLMYYFTSSDKFFGVDPWDKSIEICHSDGLKKNILLSDYLPTALPTGNKKFSLIYAFSVYTHLSERATYMTLKILLEQLAPDGILTITIRPVEFWHSDTNANAQGVVDKQVSIHKQNGFSFLPHYRAPVDDDITYGDTSMSLEWIQKSFPGAEILGIDRSINDIYQTYVFMRHKR